MKPKSGTRGTALAMSQARDLQRRLTALGHEVETVEIKTSGDKDQKNAFAAVGAPGVFVREIENALMEGRIDVAVHCYKDLPSVGPRELVIAAMPDRASQSDSLFVREDTLVESAGFLPLAAGARVGSASARRVALLRHERPDLQTGLLRGNVPTRLAKLLAGDHDAILLASAGLQRLAASAERGENESPIPPGVIQIELDPQRFVPAPSQGALALQVRADDAATHEAVSALDRPDGHDEVRAERELLALVEAGCQVPFGAWCRRAASGELELFAALERDGALRRAEARGSDPRSVARSAFEALLPEEAARR
ncbi:MAG: hydroxymethylbilane synthase [Planctomycetes bacterium]|nr:hydroxymethylbilane synthase [Planctomycetota bacterium]